MRGSGCVAALAVLALLSGCASTETTQEFPAGAVNERFTGATGQPTDVGADSGAGVDSQSQEDSAAPDDTEVETPDEGGIEDVPPAADSAVPDVAVADTFMEDTFEPLEDTPAEDTTAIDEEPAGPCPADMVGVDDFCIDTYEAPNQPGGLPLVMYTFDQAEQWCQARGKRLCFDDEWTLVCAGREGRSYPYGNTHDPGVCNDEEIWRLYNQELLSAWPYSASSAEVESYEELLGAARAVSSAAAEHIEFLYQAEGGGTNPGCTSDLGAYDLQGNVEEWTRRRDGGQPDFHGNLKGRYWAEARTCQSGVRSHGDGFRFYEIGFRCCLDQ